MRREPLVGSLIYGDHKVPKKSRPWKERWKIPAAVGMAFVVLFILAYKFYNYREEGAVKQFLGDVFSGHPDAAFAKWDVDGASYSMQDFLTDWGKDGYYTKGMKTADVIDSNGRGTSVVVYVGIDNVKVPVAIRVDKETLKLSFSPTNKYDLANP